MTSSLASAALQHLTLNGEWKVYGYQDRILSGQVPGCIHMDLKRAELIPDIHYRDNETKIYWVHEQDWEYERSFELSEDQAAAKTLILRCHGLDTLATISINGKHIKHCNNMHRTWDIPLNGAVQVGSNTIRIHFAGVLPFLKEQDQRKRIPSWNVFKDEFHGAKWLRKMDCSFGWDWGPIAPSSGIWRDIEILVSEDAFLDTVSIEQEHRAGEVTLHCEVPLCAANAQSTYSAEIEISLDGKTLAKTTAIVSGKSAHCGKASLKLKNPALWWPRDLGEQTLHDCKITLLNAAGEQCDEQTLRIGLRSLVLIRENDSTGQSFSFRVNGRDFFCKGANWVPVHNYLPGITREHYAARIQDAADAHMNMLRVWGGGIYEDNNFYELCDEQGILIWQDFMFACSGYPFFDDELCANVSEEFKDNVKRLRHHPCIALWCGNNEIEQGLVADEWTDKTMSWKDYKRVYDCILPEICNKLNPSRPYWPGSPHTPIHDRNNSNDQRSGDCHLWSVWFGNQPFEAQRDWTCRFMSEFGFQSFPEPKTLRGFTEEKDRNLSSFVMDFHQRSGMGNKTIFKYIMDWFLLPKNLDETLWLSQISQGLCVKYATEHLRRLQPHNMGVVYWQINDIWPCASWASVDYHGRWKALHYMAKQFFKPLLATILENDKKWTFDLHVSNQLMSDQACTVHWSITDTKGEVLKSGKQTAETKSQSNAAILHIDCSDLKSSHESRDILCWTQLEHNGEIIGRNFGHICKPKYITLQEPSISKSVTSLSDGRIAVTLSSNVPALWTRLECDSQDIRWTDNFLNIDGSHSIRVESVHPVQGTATALESEIRVSSLYHSAWE